MSNCSILERLTKLSVYTTYKCRICGTLSNSVDDRNVRYENLIGDSIDEILSLEENVPPISKECKNCKKNTKHAELEAHYELPDVLIICLKRFEQVDEDITKNCEEVEPTPLLHHDQSDTVYALKSVVTHFGPHTNVGHYITALHINDSQWIYCNDEITSIQNEVPKMGYLFVYEKINESPLALPIDINDEQVASTSHQKQSSSKNSKSIAQENSSSTKRLISSSSEEDEISSKKDDGHQRKRLQSEGQEFESDAYSEILSKKSEKTKVKPSLFKQIKNWFKKTNSSKNLEIERQKPMPNIQNNIKKLKEDLEYVMNSDTEDEYESEAEEDIEFHYDSEIESEVEQEAVANEETKQCETESEVELEDKADQESASDFKTKFTSEIKSMTKPETIQPDRSETIPIDSDNSGNEEIICIGCDTHPIKQKNIFRHFSKTKKTTNCEKIYEKKAPKELKYFREKSKLRKREKNRKAVKKYQQAHLTENAKAVNKYQQKNKEKRAIIVKKHQQKNKEKQRIAVKKSHKKNKETQAKAVKKYQQKNKKEQRIAVKKYQQTHKKDLSQQQKTYREEKKQELPDQLKRFRKEC